MFKVIFIWNISICVEVNGACEKFQQVFHSILDNVAADN